MYLKNGQSCIGLAGFTASGVAATGLTVTCKVWELTFDASGNPAKSPNDTTGTTTTVTEVGGGAYMAKFTATADCTPLFVFSTSGTADIKAVQTSGLALNNLDAAISTLPSAAGIADAVWDEDIYNAHTTMNTGGRFLKDTYINAGYLWGVIGGIGVSAATFKSAIATAVWAATDRTLTAFGTLVADIWAYATRSLTDKSGFAPSASDIDTQLSGTHGAGAWTDTATDLTGIARKDDVDAAQGAIIAAMPDVPPPDDGKTITPATVGTDGNPIGRVMPLGRIRVYRAGVLEYEFDADAEGDFSYVLPFGIPLGTSTWTLRASRPGLYRDTMAEVAT